MSDRQLLLFAIALFFICVILCVAVIFQLFKLTVENKKTPIIEGRPLVFIPGIEHIDILEEQLN